MSPDFAERDARIRVNSYTTVRRRETVPHPSFAAYWRDVHGPLCSRIDGLGWYVQHHFAREQDAHLWPMAGDVGPLPGYVLDGAVEIGFASGEDQQRFQDASPILFSDEQNVFEETIAYQLPRGSTTVVDRQPDPTPNGPDALDRVHVHLSARRGSEQALADALTGPLAGALKDDEHVAKLRLHLPEHREPDADEPPAPRVAHHVGPERESIAVVEVAYDDPLARRRSGATPAVQDALEAVAETVTHATAFPVAGVHTFVRDGQLTTAGLRGSRVAELITELAALNQTEADVVALMRGA